MIMEIIARMMWMIRKVGQSSTFIYIYTPLLPFPLLCCRAVLSSRRLRSTSVEIKLIGELDENCVEK